MKKKTFNIEEVFKIILRAYVAGKKDGHFGNFNEWFNEEFPEVDLSTLKNKK